MSCSDKKMSKMYDLRTKKKILLHSGDDAIDKAFAFFSQDSIVLSDPTGDFSIQIAKDYGICIQGPLSLMQSPGEVRVAGLWKINPLVISALPSTLYTPIPWLKRSIPLSSKELMKSLSAISALI